MRPAAAGCRFAGTRSAWPRVGLGATGGKRGKSRRRCPNRNGGRHCCQPPLRRARICRCSWVRSAEASPSLDPDSPAQASLPTAAARESLAFSSFPSRRKFRLGQLMSRPKTKQLRCSTALLGMITSASRFASTVPKNGFSRVAQKEDHLFRRLFPAGHGSFPREFTTACRQRSVLEPLSHRLAREPSGETATAVPITR